jgi:hypothetical protein
MDRRIKCEYTEQQKNRIHRHKDKFNIDLDDLIEDDHFEIYNNQEQIAYKIVGAFKDRKIINIMVLSKTQSGKTGSMLATIKLYLQDSSNLIPLEHIFIITGLSSVEWIEQTKERMPECLRDNIIHRDKLGTFVDKIKDKKNILIIMDEIQVAAKKGQSIYKAFSNAGLLDKKILYEHDVKIVEYTATPDGTIYDLMKWKDASDKILGITGEGYVGASDLLHMGRVKQYKDLCGYQKGKEDDKQDYGQILKNIKEIENDIKQNYSECARYHIIRTKQGNEQDITIANFKKIFSEEDYDFVTYDQTSNINDINMILKEKPIKHTFVFIKEKVRCAKTLKPKTYLGILYERYTNREPDDAAIIQGLLGRDTGYDNNSVSICYTNIDTIERYEKLWMSHFEDDTIRWVSKTTKYQNGVMTANDTFNDPKEYEFASANTSNAPVDYEPTIVVKRTYKEIKEYYASELKDILGGRGPNEPKKNNDGFYIAEIRKNKKVFSTAEVKKEQKWGLKNSRYRFHACYEDVNDDTTLQFWLIYYPDHQLI